MRINTVHFGPTEIDENCILTFPEGLLGFENLRRFAVIVCDQTEPLRWLQSIDDETVALPVIDPFIIKGDYEVDVEDAQLSLIQADSSQTVIALGVMVLPTDLSNATLNLTAPLLINTEKNLGMQYVVETRIDNALRYPAYEALMKYYKEAAEHAGAHAQGE